MPANPWKDTENNLIVEDHFAMLSADLANHPYNKTVHRKALELQVRIEGRDRTFLLSLDALEGHGLSGPAEVEELRGIRAVLEDLGRAAQRQGL